MSKEALPQAEHNFQKSAKIYCSRSAEGRMHASLLDDIPDERFLAIVRCQDGDLLCRIAPQPHVLECQHHILCFSNILHASQSQLSAAQ